MAEVTFSSTATLTTEVSETLAKFKAINLQLNVPPELQSFYFDEQGLALDPAFDLMHAIFLESLAVLARRVRDTGSSADLAAFIKLSVDRLTSVAFATDDDSKLTYFKNEASNV